MNVSTPPKHPWQPQRYKHLCDTEQTEWTRLIVNLVKDRADMLESLLELRDKMKLFDNTHAHVVEEIRIRSTGTPPRSSCTLDGIEVGHLLSADTPIACDSTIPYWNIVTLPFICRKYSSCDSTNIKERRPHGLQNH